MTIKLLQPVAGFNSDLKLKGFKAYEVGGDKGGHNYSRKDFYKINITTGKFNFHYADRTFETDETFLFFGNPHIPYSCENVSKEFHGYTCIFSEEFLKVGDRSESLQHSPLFKIGGTPIFTLNNEQASFITGVFKRMILEQDTGYAFKDELMHNYINLLIHEAMKLQPSENYSNHKNAAQRITSVFLELLERQFPIENTEKPLQLKTAQQFAKQLSVHPNYLNRTVKEVTGKSTTTLISERVISEAKALLIHTDWNSADIAYALGFEYPTYFNNFFKKMTGTNPMSLRAEEV